MRNKQRNAHQAHQRGFSLIEILVGLVIGLIVTLVISQTLIGFEGQKRTTSGNADAQTSGSIALYMIQRQVQMAGYGVPIYTNNSPLRCTNSNTAFDHDNDAAATTPTPAINLSPVTIVDGGTATGASDSITLGRSQGDFAGLPVTISGSSALPVVVVENNMGCRVGDVALLMNQAGTTCALRKVTAITGTTKITLNTADTSDIAIVDGATRISCPGTWFSVTYSVQNGTLFETPSTSDSVAVQRPIMSNIVNFQAQYGVAASATSGPVTNWVNATGTWAALSVADRNRIRAVRLVIVARNELLERDVVANPPCATGLCTWEGDAAGVAGTSSSVDIRGTANWNRYRYRTFETVIPLRNMTWSTDKLG